MNRTLLINLFLFCIAAAAAFFFYRTTDGQHGTDTKIPTAGDSLIERNAADEACVRDAGGALIPTGAYKKIVSLSTSVDAWLNKCVGAERIHAYCSYSDNKPYASLLAGKQHFSDARDIEALMQAGGDLIIMPSMGGDVSVVNRLREAGLTVFNIGDMSGLQAFNRSAKQIAWLCKVPVAGDALLGDFNAKMATLAGHIPVSKRKSALYLGVFGDQVYGGTRGSSYHDVLVTAGLRDRSTELDLEWSSAWPQYSAEQVILMNPDIIVSQQGMAERIKALPGFAVLHAVRENNIIEIDSSLLNDAGLLMYEASKQLQYQAYGTNP
jgi:iron complex transport system substrate-binding protein